jgi:[NiFe] hydrogenase assembly HybE family chaperone
MSADGYAGGGFESGWFAQGLSDDAVLECGICWRIYDPSHGDRSRGVAAGTPFSALPEDWRCPECDSAKDKFLLVDAGAGPKRGPEAPSMEKRLDALLRAYRDADLAMRALPIYNPNLRVAAIGFRAYQSAYVGALVTPWFLNIVLLPKEKSKDARASGATRSVVFPSGGYVFSHAALDGVGAFEFCSLFSPMRDFEGQDAARIAADAVITALFEIPPAASKPAAREAAPSRRTLLMGRRRVADGGKEA